MLSVTEVLRDYYAASNRDDLAAMVVHYHEPVTFIGATGVTSLMTREQAKSFVAQFFARVRSMGAVRTEWTESHVNELSDTLAVADIGLVRFAEDGREVERLAFVYVLHKTPTGWKIALLASHPAETILHVDRSP